MTLPVALPDSSLSSTTCNGKSSPFLGFSTYSLYFVNIFLALSGELDLSFLVQFHQACMGRDIFCSCDVASEYTSQKDIGYTAAIKTIKVPGIWTMQLQLNINVSILYTLSQ